jgi:hypothetical protein
VRLELPVILHWQAELRRRGCYIKLHLLGQAVLRIETRSALRAMDPSVRCLALGYEPSILHFSRLHLAGIANKLLLSIFQACGHAPFVVRACPGCSFSLGACGHPHLQVAVTALVQPEANC